VDFVDGVDGVDDVDRGRRRQWRNCVPPSALRPKPVIGGHERPNDNNGDYNQHENGQA